jgi:hypothetical protein
MNAINSFSEVIQKEVSHSAHQYTLLVDVVAGQEYVLSFECGGTFAHCRMLDKFS